MSEVLEQPGHMALPYVKWIEKSKSDGALYLAGGDSDEPSRFLNDNPTSVKSEVDMVADSPTMEMPVEKISKRKKKKKKKGKSTKSLTDKIVSGTSQRRSGSEGAVASCQSSKERMDKPASNFEKGLKNDPPSAVVTSQCASRIYGCSKDPSAHNGKKLPECYNVGIPDLTGNYLLADIRNCNNNESSTCCEGSKLSKQEPEGASTNFYSQYILGSQSTRHLSQCKSYETTNRMCCEAKDCIGCTGEDTKTSGLCCSARNVRHITPSNDFKSNTLASQHDALHKTSSQNPIQSGKENSHLVWQKSQKNVKEAHIHWKKRSNFNYVERDASLLEKKFQVKHNSFSSRGLLPSPLISPPGYNNAAHAIKKMENKGSHMHRRMHGRVLVDSSQWAAQQRLIGNFYKYVSGSSQLGAREFEDCKKLRPCNSFKHENNYYRKKGLGGYGGNFFRLCDKSVLSEKESSQALYELHHYRNGNSAQRTVYNSQCAESHGSYCLDPSPAFSALIQLHLPPSTNLSVQGQGVLNGFQPYSEMRTDLKFHNEDKFRQNVTSGASGKKWIPVGTKASRLLKQTSSAGSCNHFVGNFPSSQEEIDSRPEGNIISLCGPPTFCDSKCTGLISSHKMTSVKHELPISKTSNAEICGRKVESANDYAYGEKPNLDPQFLIGSHRAAEALKAVYQLQLASEGVQLAMGYPLAEFERLVHSAAPVIASSYAYEKCAVCMDNKLSHSFLCKHQIPNVSLSAVWNWYEKPGNYGLEVKADDSQNLYELPTDSISFLAHFVPYLSAVQLFGCSHIHNCCDKSREHINLEMQDKGEVESHVPKTLFVTCCSEASDINHDLEEDINLEVKFDSVEEPISSSKVSPCKGSDLMSFDCLPTFCDSELIFEFFESEQPQQRKPLYDKIVELIDVGTSNCQVYGDPSKLELMNLHEIHPASWFSVAWYPIYRIPEGNFRASFLTYHSLGHLIQRRILTDSPHNIFSAVSPVLGLQSYNTQGECWFDPRVPVETFLKELTPFNSSEILKERLRTLEQNALLFARGCVCKDSVMVCNRQPDYEFFISRKN